MATHQVTCVNHALSADRTHQHITQLGLGTAQGYYRRITVNAVAPGPVQTAINERTPAQVAAREARLPLGRLGQPEDVAGPIVFLASDLASWITGHVLAIDGGELLLGRT